MKLTTVEMTQSSQGQIAVALIAVRALLINHPQRDAAAATIHADYEALFSRMHAMATPQAFLDGMQQSLDQLLKKPEDKGQPARH